MKYDHEMKIYSTSQNWGLTTGAVTMLWILAVTMALQTASAVEKVNKYKTVDCKFCSPLAVDVNEFWRRGGGDTFRNSKVDSCTLLCLISRLKNMSDATIATIPTASKMFFCRSRFIEKVYVRKFISRLAR